ncbi:hypothetical protein, partial [Methylobacterium sp. WL116]|uniref:hypothetical protein n=1 Tax=Methylobacterium sp. WL116 TaxID=2603889 RepID=UPI001AED6514
AVPRDIDASSRAKPERQGVFSRRDALPSRPGMDGICIRRAASRPARRPSEARLCVSKRGGAERPSGPSPPICRGNLGSNSLFRDAADKNQA